MASVYDRDQSKYLKELNEHTKSESKKTTVILIVTSIGVIIAIVGLFV